MGKLWKLCDAPYFEPAHRELAERVTRWTSRALQGAAASATAKSSGAEDSQRLAAECRTIARELGEAGLLGYVVPPDPGRFDVRSLCVIREALTYECALADAVFAMQGIGTLAIQQFGSHEQQAKYLDPCRRGTAIAAFALTELEAGSDVASLKTTASRSGHSFVINGEKTLISNAGFADHYVVVARTGEAPGSRGLSAFIVDAGTPGLHAGPPIQFIAEHPAASLRFEDCRIPAGALIGTAGQGFKVAMAAFDIFRPSVGAAAIGLARRALAETLARVSGRNLFGKPMGDMQSVQMMLADMAADIDAAALTVYHAAWVHDVRKDSGSYAASMAKLVATESAARVVDRAVQLHGGAGVTQGNLIEQLYREARPMRIYEGASEVQKLIIARKLLASFAMKE
jgi:acyl-CoA dehydrogenase